MSEISKRHYRAEYRNEARRRGLLHRWGAWVQANIVAKLPRAAYHVTKLQGGAALALTALKNFWRDQFGKGGTSSRVIYRILRDLGGVDTRRAFV